GALGGGERPQLRVVLDPLALPPLAPQAGGVDEDELTVTAPEDRVDRVSRRARLVGDDHALLPEQRIQQAGLADVWAAEDRDADGGVRYGGAPPPPQGGHHRGGHGAGARAPGGPTRELEPQAAAA